MSILSGIPVLHCHTIEDTLNFYQQVLQFVIVKKRELSGQLHWVHLMHGSTTLMLQRADSAVVTGQQNNISLYFFIENINELHHLLKAKSNIESIIVETDYNMQELTILDPEGNHLTLGQKS